MKRCSIAVSVLLVVIMGRLDRFATAAQTTGAANDLRAEIEALRPAHIAWREIAWKSCLLEGLKESSERKKPLMLWVFIDRPADDARC